MNMILSIIVPVYNVEQYLEKCLLSIVQQQDVSADDYEIIIINDGSPDNSIAIAEGFAECYSNIRILSQENCGLSAARNTGIAAANGDYVWCIDSDDWIEPCAVRFLLDEIKKDTVDFLTIAARFSDSGKVRNVQLQTNNPYKLLISQTWEHNAQYCIYNRIFLQRNGLFFMRGIYHEDSEFTPRMMYLAKSCNVTNKVLYNSYCNPNSIMHTPNSKKSFDNIKVAISLRKFVVDSVSEVEVQKTLNNNIAMLINNAIYHILYHKETEQNKLNDFIHDNRVLICSSLRGTRFFKYKIEGVLFHLFPRHYVGVYGFLKKIII